MKRTGHCEGTNFMYSHTEMIVTLLDEAAHLFHKSVWPQKPGDADYTYLPTFHIVTFSIFADCTYADPYA